MNRLEGLRTVAGWRPQAHVRVWLLDSVPQVQALVELADGPLPARKLAPGVVGALARRGLVAVAEGQVELTERARRWLEGSR